MKEAIIGLGTNLLNREENLKNAINSLKKIPETTVEKISSIYETEPFETSYKQKKYLNCCVKIKTNLPPGLLLGSCLGIEAAMGRIRPYKNAPRIIDLDLLLYQGVSVCTEFLTLPHPRISERAFVLIPLQDLYEEKIALGYDFDCAFNRVNLGGVSLYKKFLL